MFRLRRLGIEVVLLPSGGSEVLEGLSQARSDDLVVLFSFSKVSREGRMILAYQKQARYRTLAFTSRSYLPEDERADMNLFVYRGEAKEYHSMTAPAAWWTRWWWPFRKSWGMRQFSGCPTSTG